MSMYGQEGLKVNLGESVVPEAEQNLGCLNVSSVDGSHAAENMVKKGASSLCIGFIIGGVILFVAVVVIAFFAVKKCRQADYSGENVELIMDPFDDDTLELQLKLQEELRKHCEPPPYSNKFLKN